MADIMRRLSFLVQLDELKTIPFWKAVFAELYGTFILMFVQALLPLGLGNPSLSGNLIRIALGMSFLVCFLGYTLGPVSGGHFNPAVTISMLSGQRILPLRALAYIFVQCVGSLSGAALAYRVTPGELRETLSATVLHPSVTVVQGLTVEFALTSFLVLAAFISSEERNRKAVASHVLGGFTVGFCVLTGSLYTGASMNPARSLGPAVILSGELWNHHWIYWTGPISGGLFSSFIYNYILKKSTTISTTQKVSLSDTSKALLGNDEDNTDPSGIKISDE